jgi:hypothetical protein
MNTEINTPYNLSPNSYAAFDAISIRNLIIERLNSQGVFTDQNYIGSNLASIIDIISFTFNTLLFYLNRTSSESIFTEAQLYENISRIVKLLDYNPVGYQTSTLPFQLSANNNNNTFLASTQFYTIPRYSYITVSGVPFSFNEDISFSVSALNKTIELSDIANKKLLFQGTYRETPTYVANGATNEMFTINSVNALIDHFNIDVYVYETSASKWIQYKEVRSLYLEQPNSRSFEKRLNSNLQYEITFGNGVNGRQLISGENVVIYFLQSSGAQGVIGPRALSMNTINYDQLNTRLFKEISLDVKQDNTSIYISTNEFRKLMFDNITGSTQPKDIETADEIRTNAPATFRSQYRLVTQRDFEVFVKTNFSNFISDVKVFNNWEYTSSYIKYLQSLNVDPVTFKQVPLNQLLFSDACNFNNVYVCAVPRIGLTSSLKYLLPAQKEKIISGLQETKTITTEIAFLDPIYKGVHFGIENEDGKVIYDERVFCKLRIVKTPNTSKSNQSIINETATVFKRHFSPLNRRLGQIVDYSQLVTDILSLDGVDSIFTVRDDIQKTYSGLRLFVWNATFPYLDNIAVSYNVATNPFDFVFFDELSNIVKNIYVVDNTYSVTNV